MTRNLGRATRRNGRAGILPNRHIKEKTLADPAAHSFWSGGHRHRWLKSAIKMMMGMGTPSIKSKIERI